MSLEIINTVSTELPYYLHGDNYILEMMPWKWLLDSNYFVALLANTLNHSVPG
ncbi:TPA: hypothetical protein ACPSKY_002754 [Legionella bozemanae]